MLAGCSSSSLLSPRHRLRSDYSSMSTQRLDLPCTFPQNPTSRQPSVRPVSLSVEAPIESRRQHLKRFAEQSSFEEDLTTAKRRKSNLKSDEEDSFIGSLTQLGSENFWFHDPISSPFFPRQNHPQILRLGEKNDEPSQKRVGPVKDPARSSSPSSSDTRRLIQNIPEHDAGTGNGSRLPNPNQNREVLITGHVAHVSHEEQIGFEAVSLLMGCIDSFGSKNITGINHFISKLGELASPRGGSAITRLVAYFTEALAIRAALFWPHIFHINPPRQLNQVEEDTGSVFRILNQISPIPKFIHFTSNEIILRSFEGKDRVHIIDFDIKQGLQWPSLFQSLATRPNPPSHIRITGVGESKIELMETGERLAGFAAALNLQFEFHAVVDRLEDVRVWMLHVKENETVAINCVFQLHKMLYDPTYGVLRDFLNLIKSTNPVILVIAEEEVELNEAALERRVSNSLNYYSALFDSIDSALPLDSPARVNVEEMFGREIRNIIACEGRDRFSRHEKFEEWRRLMEGGGFRCVGINEREFMQSRMLLKMYSDANYRVCGVGDGGGGITISWSDQPLYTVSAWSAVDLGGSSSGSKPGMG